MTTDSDVLGHIERLAEEEHALTERGSHDALSTVDQERLDRIERQLDQCWDLLRQRRARRNAGLDPDDAQPRPIDEVEDYLQ